MVGEESLDIYSAFEAGEKCEVGGCFVVPAPCKGVEL